MGQTSKDERDAMTSGVMRARPARAQLDASRVAYHLVRPRGPSSPTLLAAYATWRQGWSTAFRELGAAADVPSDEFTRLDEVGVLVTEGRCVSVTGVRWLDLGLPMSLDDSYFKAWPRHVLESLGAGLLGVSCNTIVAQEWRGALVHPTSGDPVALKDLTIRMSLRRFLGSSARVFVGVARNDRNMHRVAGGLGSRRMARIELHGVESDICGWTRSDVADLGPIVEDLWARRSDA